MTHRPGTPIHRFLPLFRIVTERNRDKTPKKYGTSVLLCRNCNKFVSRDKVLNLAKVKQDIGCYHCGANNSDWLFK